MFISISHKNISEPKIYKRLELEKEQFEQLFDAMGLNYEYWGYTIPSGSMRKMNKWRIPTQEDDGHVIELDRNYICYLSE